MAGPSSSTSRKYVEASGLPPNCIQSVFVWKSWSVLSSCPFSFCPLSWNKDSAVWPPEWIPSWPLTKRTSSCENMWTFTFRWYPVLHVANNFPTILKPCWVFINSSTCIFCPFDHLRSNAVISSPSISGEDRTSGPSTPRQDFSGVVLVSHLPRFTWVFDGYLVLDFGGLFWWEKKIRTEIYCIYTASTGSMEDTSWAVSTQLVKNEDICMIVTALPSHQPNHKT